MPPFSNADIFKRILLSIEPLILFPLIKNTPPFYVMDSTFVKFVLFTEMLTFVPNILAKPPPKLSFCLKMKDVAIKDEEILLAVIL